MKRQRYPKFTITVFWYDASAEFQERILSFSKEMFYKTPDDKAEDGLNNGWVEFWNLSKAVVLDMAREFLHFEEVEVAICRQEKK